MGYIAVGPNGELALPADLCERLGVKPGDEVEVAVNDGDPARVSLLVRRRQSVGAQPVEMSKKPYRLEDFFGIAGRVDRPISQEEIDATVRMRAAEKVFGQRSG
ncbi:AbrB/MazE/SpoVT family DNA-binding domain-containing protein [Azospirillum sp. SYSU D00513]|uniref:AbrB/MazE/SpoVT family DNA-binding domain-containing protein n=1 Tax=Azospirillum sp. SYSU D00513 TaxID=2812561 RepID=UPI001A95B4CF|nr:AbrB/MazE/SpoVT family DNA-binding domain-containing protein [Azospirillum sp. SYSU D00513]